ncbi:MULTISPECIES: ATP-binding protein [Chryseobacterium]|uniref:AAA+ ATPase domain-containing protein n=1 Tax=Candidatus Chryseobacterium massiliense TaxID=204089 RepID=A0A3D9B2S6_9FLAO|nr:MULTISPECIES: ATP-binding protein [Chryseobacterium]REC47849.1 hypothetical protein DRF68_12470 [Candidatus Chryseobacterium massiliae]
MRAIGINAFIEKAFDTLAFDGEWKDSFGEPEKNFKMILYGGSGEGKTEFTVRFSKYLAGFGKVSYISPEQGISKSLQDAIKRNSMEEVAGKVMFLTGGTFDELLTYIKKSRSKFIIIDSLDYMKLTVDQFKILIAKFPKKAFIIIAWAKNGSPKSQHAKDIEFMCDIKSLVESFTISLPTSRFGGNKPFIIWKGASKKPVKNVLPSLFD